MTSAPTNHTNPVAAINRPPGIFAQGKPRPEPLHRVRHEKCAQCDDRRNADARRLAEREVFDRMRQAHHDEHDGDPSGACAVDRLRVQGRTPPVTNPDTMRLLGIETSCDDTAAAIVVDGRSCEANVLASQDEFHREYGGVVPEIASRKHAETLNAVIELAMHKARVNFDELDGVAVTCGPGLAGSLVVGVAAAQAIAYARDLHAYAVNHLHGHLFANYLESADEPHRAPPEAPFVCLVVSGGHTDLIDVHSPGEHRVIGRTLDDAAGEAFDKVARLLGLGFPGGPLLDELARTGDPNAFTFPRPLINDDDNNFSFSGLKTAVRYHLDAHPLDAQERRADVAASFQAAVVDVLCTKTLRAARLLGVNTIALAGGVSANSALRAELRARGKAMGLRVLVPPLAYCTDNAAMIAAAAFYRGDRARVAPEELRADPNFAW
jgi:tRNA N6-adenosine threonylcarbamoyltransferase